MSMDDQHLAAIPARSFDRGLTVEAQRLDLRPFAEQLIAIAEQLRSSKWAEAGEPERQPSPHQPERRRAPAAQTQLIVPSDPAQARLVYLEMAREAYTTRRQRTAIFGNVELFGEPAWDILLDLYIAHVENKAVSVSSACIGSASPPTTGLRWLGVLAEHDLVLREHDPEDQRRVLVRLTDRGLDAMDTYFAHAAQRAACT
ncbi:MAG: winged helix DNA-binding protein [Pseudomonadota bacterium]